MSILDRLSHIHLLRCQRPRNDFWLRLLAEIVGYLGEAHAATPAPPEPTEAELAQAAETIRDRFERIAWPAVLAAGLLDGVNPCAFVTVIFLLSYLSLLKYRRRDAMLVGAAFTAAVFATYLLIGLGFLAFAGYLQEQPHFGDGYCVGE